MWQLWRHGWTVHCLARLRRDKPECGARGKDGSDSDRVSGVDVRLMEGVCGHVISGRNDRRTASALSLRVKPTRQFGEWLGANIRISQQEPFAGLP